MRRRKDDFDRQYLPFACLMSHVSNLMGAKTKPSDFMPQKEQTPKKVTAAMFLAMGAGDGT